MSRANAGADVDIIELCDRVARWLESASRHRTQATAEYLDVIQLACEGLLDLPPGVTDQSRLLQERVRALYGDAALVLAPRLSSQDLRHVMNALGSARIYYWIRVLDVDGAEGIGSREELDRLIVRRGGPVGKATSSLSAVDRALLAMCPDEWRSREDRWSLDGLRAACLRDFGMLHSLRARMRAS